MKALKIIGVAILVLVVTSGIAVAILPSHVHLERSITVNASPEKIYQVVNSYQNFNKWSPWAKLDPNTRYEFSGASSGVGSVMSWVSEHSNVGKGTQQIVESEENKHVKSEMSFEGMTGKAFSDLILTPEGSATRVTWTYDGDLAGFEKIFGLMMDTMLGPFYEQGLTSLKEHVESLEEMEPLEEGPATPPR